VLLLLLRKLPVFGETMAESQMMAAASKIKQVRRASKAKLVLVLEGPGTCTADCNNGER
jgi:hypothetical protein